MVIMHLSVNDYDNNHNSTRCKNILIDPSERMAGKMAEFFIPSKLFQAQVVLIYPSLKKQKVILYTNGD